jgi:hypothetical protein
VTPDLRHRASLQAAEKAGIPVEDTPPPEHLLQAAARAAAAQAAKAAKAVAGEGSDGAGDEGADEGAGAGSSGSGKDASEHYRCPVLDCL